MTTFEIYDANDRLIETLYGVTFTYAQRRARTVPGGYVVTRG